MIYTTQIPHVKAPWKSAVTLGKFDGLHRGHQKLIECIQAHKQKQWRTVVFTFDVPPRSHMLHMPPKFLLTYEERRELAEAFGVDILAECPFTDELMHMEPEQFVKEYLVDRLQTGFVAVGPDFRFGYERRGNPRMLAELGEIYGFQVQVLEKEKDGNLDISSTYIREELEKGNMEKVNDLLGYPYFTRERLSTGGSLEELLGFLLQISFLQR